MAPISLGAVASDQAAIFFRLRVCYEAAVNFGLFLSKDIMAFERTLSILKPDATRRNLTGAINVLIEKTGLRIVAQKRVRMTREQAETFYEVHKARPFFGKLVATMTAGPVVVQVLEGENAIASYRDVLGAMDPAEAAPGTIRRIFAVSAAENSALGARVGWPRDRRGRDRAMVFRQ